MRSEACRATPGLVKMAIRGLGTSFHMAARLRHGRHLLAGFIALWMLACSSSTTPDAVPAAAPAMPAPHGAATPAAAVTDLIADLRRNALADLPRTALPPALYARVEAGWRAGRSRWPLTELPLDDSIPGLLHALTQPDAERKLQARFRQQLSGQTRALQEAARGLGLWGRQYLAREGQYNAQQRRHYVQLVDAVSSWAAQAPLGDPERGRDSVHLLVNGAARGAPAGADDFSRMGMDASLKGLVPLYLAGKQMLGRYGLGVDAALASVRADTVEIRGDTATVRVKYLLAGREIETVMDVVRRDGRWYLADYLAAAEASLADGADRP